MQITVDDVLSWYPCEGYRARKKLLTITGGRESLTPFELLDLNIPWEDRLWVLLREPIFTQIELRLLACDFAEHVLPIWEKWAREYLPSHLNSFRNMIRIIRKFPDQPIKWEVDWVTAWEAAWVTAWDSAGPAGPAVDAVLAAGASGDHDGAAALAAVDAALAVRDAAVAAGANKNDEIKWQIELIRKKLEERQCR
jgi:hypothetical protein